MDLPVRPGWRPALICAAGRPGGSPHAAPGGLHQPRPVQLAEPLVRWASARWMLRAMSAAVRHRAASAAMEARITVA